MSSKLRTIEDAVRTRLLARSLFADATPDAFTGILTERQEQWVYEVDRAVEAFGGLLITVAIRTGTSSMFNVPGPRLDDCTLLVTIDEDPSLNSTANGGRGISCKEALEEVLKALHQSNPVTGDGSILLVSRDPAFQEAANPRYVSYACPFQLAVNLPDEVNQ